MKLIDALKKWESDKKDWPDGFNFKNKSKFIGIANHDDSIILTQELMDSEEWAMTFESRDKEFNDLIKLNLGDF